MGRALAGALLDSGHDVTVWNRSPGKGDELVARGARAAASVDEAISASDVTVVCLLNDASVREALAPAAGKLSGRTLINLTSGSAPQARELAGWAAEHGARFVAGGIMAGPWMIGTSDAFVLYSGARDTFDAVVSTLGAFGRSQWVGDDPGAAALYDMAALSGMYGMGAGADHAVALVHAEGGDVETFKREVLLPWLEAMLPLAVRGAAVGGAVSDDSNAAMQATGLETMLATSEKAGVPTELTGHLRASLWRMRQAVEAGRTLG